MDRRVTSRRKRRIVWTCAIVALLLLLALTPPLLNVNRLQRRIAASISASLGRTVHLDRVTMHLLPVPGFTLENLTVSEESGFGWEPVIRANTVEVTLRPSSLWRRQVEFSSIKFIDPSLNLVRNHRGEWNIQSLLMHAASVNTAPTAQTKAGPAPRFPYIEATGARVNLKIGEEKKPFSLTETDFALWLPSPQQWRVRMEGKPTRTDANISDPGTIRLEGTLQRAGSMTDVPVDLSASWEGVPLGETSKLLTGDDAGWRGNLTVSATLTGTLGAAKLNSKVHVSELRRAEFIPVLSMDLVAECAGTLNVATAVVADPDCSVNTPAAEEAKGPGHIAALADSVDLSTLKSTGLHAGMTNISNAWLLDWARLFTQRIPAGERPGGTIAGTVALVDDARTPARWQGEIHGTLAGVDPWKATEPALQVHPISITTPQVAGRKGAADESGASGNEFVLAPITFTSAGKTPVLAVSGTASRDAYTLRVAGTPTMEQLETLRSVLPPLGDGLTEALPASAGASAAKAVTFDITCTRRWGAGQTCASTAPVPSKKTRRALERRVR
jgi:hypothetical protein